MCYSHSDKDKLLKWQNKAETKAKQIKDIIIQVGLMAYFTIYFVAHHFLGVFGTRWILYVGVAAVALYVF